ncbi:hypothetical protein BLNAU_15841 [Blattamonas nauphoetae]|uniref:Uncharacterized protein n=1 Tax=Blattamonas nauphoetae TaxID=2049346 RepID=A0ABQ9X9M0_9EUKA|nr:hypothetical protein BLNAU_15841 [Blattamonas nauphoetae]
MQCSNESRIVDTLQQLQKVASEIVDALFVQHTDVIVSTFTSTVESSPPSAVLTTLARLSLFPHPRIAFNSLLALSSIVERDPPALTHLPFIFPSPTIFRSVAPPKYIQLTNDDPFFIGCSLSFCSTTFFLPLHLFDADPPIEVDSEIIRGLILFVKDTITTVLTTISNIDTLTASLPSEHSLTTPLFSGVDTQITQSLKYLRKECVEFVDNGWDFFVYMTYKSTDTHRPSFQTIILDDPSFPDLVLNSLKLDHTEIRENILITVHNIVVDYPWMNEQFMATNLVGRMFETDDFVSLPLSESNTLFELTKFILSLSTPIGNDEDSYFEQYRLIRVSVFEPAKHFITFMFSNSNKLLLDEEDQVTLDHRICLIHSNVKNMELRSDEHDADIVSELVKWEMRSMIEMENEQNFESVFNDMLSRTSEWNQNQRERQKRREVLLREEGWDDAFELRVVGIELDTNDEMKECTRRFRVELTFNADEL